MKKFTLILIIVAALVVGYAFFYVGLALVKALIGLGVVCLMGFGGFMGYIIGSKTKTKKEA